MVEVFKTNVARSPDAVHILALLHHSFPEYTANFDLEDCDRILRVMTPIGPVRTDQVIDLIRNSGFRADVLTDEVIDLRVECRHQPGSVVSVMGKTVNGELLQ